MSQYPILVQKFGGTSVANIDNIKLAASKVVAAIRDGYYPIVVVSAMAGVTNQLVSYCKAISSLTSEEEISEYDVALSSGEVITAALMALALRKEGVVAESLMGWQVPIATNNLYSKALIEKIDNVYITSLLNRRIVPVVAGFQGLSEYNRITTLGRGGSDTTAAALAAAMGASFCDIYTDVEGIFTTDPRLVHNAKRIDIISYEEMLEFASMGAKVLHTRSVQIGMRYNVPIRVISTFASNLNYTLVTSKSDDMENRKITGITYTKNIASVLIRYNNASAINLSEMMKQNFQILQSNINYTNSEVAVLVGLEDLLKLQQYIENIDRALSHEVNSDIGQVSIVGFGVKNDKNLLGEVVSVLEANDINISSIIITEVTIGLIMPASFTEKAVQLLHEYLRLDV